MDARLRRLRKEVTTTAGYNMGVTVALQADTRSRAMDFREETGQPSLGNYKQNRDDISHVDLRGPHKLYLH